jgi:diaminopimelate epimerase
VQAINKMQLNISKANGTKNHFLIIHSNDQSIHNKDVIIKIVKSSNSDRIDGVLILSDSQDLDFKMDYYNNDGTWETMCANGARCAALYMYDKNLVTKEKMIFEAGDGNHEAEIIGANSVKLKMKSPKYCSDKIDLLGVSGFHIDSGATHFAVEYNNIDNTTVKELGAKIRYDKEFEPRGINVNFYEVINSHEIYVKTYEKGIENLMMSCGSGSVACAYHLSKLEQVESPVHVHVIGGKLQIDFDNEWENVWISGHAEIENDINIEI